MHRRLGLTAAALAVLMAFTRVYVGSHFPLDVVAASGMSSPYPQLWSLPVRVQDPRLGDLERVMSGPAAPRWMVVAGASLDSWGVDARTAQDYLEQHYGEQVSYGDWHVWQRLEAAQR